MLGVLNNGGFLVSSKALTMLMGHVIYCPLKCSPVASARGVSSAYEGLKLETFSLFFFFIYLKIVCNNRSFKMALASSQTRALLPKQESTASFSYVVGFLRSGATPTPQFLTVFGFFTGGLLGGTVVFTSGVLSVPIMLPSPKEGILKEEVILLKLFNEEFQKPTITGLYIKKATAQNTATTIKIIQIDFVFATATELSLKPCIGITVLKASFKSSSPQPLSVAKVVRISSRVLPLANSPRMYPLRSGYASAIAKTDLRAPRSMFSACACSGVGPDAPIAKLRALVTFSKAELSCVA